MHVCLPTVSADSHPPATVVPAACGLFGLFSTHNVRCEWLSLAFELHPADLQSGMDGWLVTLIVTHCIPPPVCSLFYLFIVTHSLSHHHCLSVSYYHLSSHTLSSTNIIRTTGCVERQSVYCTLCHIPLSHFPFLLFWNGHSSMGKSHSSILSHFQVTTMPLPIFGKSHKSPADVVKNLKEALLALEKVGGGMMGR